MFFNRLKTIAVSLLLIGSSFGTATAIETSYGDLTLESKGLLLLGGVPGDKEEGVTNLRKSFLQLGASYNINQVKAGLSATYYFERLCLFGREPIKDEDNTGLKRVYLYLSNPELGKTQIGYTSSVIDDYFLKAQGYQFKQSYSLPLELSNGLLNHRNTWRYESSQNNYFNYALSITHKEKVDFGKSSQYGLNVNWKYQINDDYRLTVQSLIGKLVNKRKFSTANLDYKDSTIPFSLGLNLAYKDSLQASVTGYYAKSKFKASNTTTKAEETGWLSYISYTPVSSVTLYSSYTSFNYKYKEVNLDKTSSNFSLGVLYNLPILDNKLNFGLFTEYNYLTEKVKTAQVENDSVKDNYYVIGAYASF